MLKVIGVLLLSYAMLISIAAGPDLNSKGFKNRLVECIDKYRVVLLMSLVGSILMQL